MEGKTERDGFSLRVVVDTMPGRELRLTDIDQQIYAGSTGFYGIYPYSPAGDKKDMELPY